MTVAESLTAGREAVRRYAWEESVDAFLEASRDSDLEPADLELLATAQYWAGHPDASVETLERAYAGYLDGGQSTNAARVALLIGYKAMHRLAVSVAQAWMGRAERLLEDETESEVHAFFTVLRAAEAFFVANDLDATVRFAGEALELARTHESKEAEALALSLHGYALISSGRWEEGLSLSDQATVAAVSGELELSVASDVYCNTIAACRMVGDFRRSSEWTEEAERWMHRHGVRGYPGVCRVHRAELKRLQGAWPEAEEEALSACTELERYRLLIGVGFAHYEIGEVRLRRGDLQGAEEAFLRAYEYGMVPQPGMAVLMMARGDVEEGAAVLHRVLAQAAGSGETHPNRYARCRLLPAQVEAALARGDLETARAATEELEDIAGEFRRSAFEAAALVCRGAVDLEEERPGEAAQALDKAWRMWAEIDFPYDSARARVLLGRAYLASGDRSRAQMEWATARSIFSRLGATRDLREVEESMSALTPRGGGERVERTFMFTDIVTSTDLVELIGDAAWEQLLAWHDRELRSAFAAYRGEVVNHTGDGFFVAFDTASQAVDAAVAIQRRLAQHRHQHGFAPSVRIGIHTAEASRESGDYRGKGVHVAARVGAVGGADEIVVSSTTLAAEEIDLPVSEPHEMTLKGVQEPVAVSTVGWR